MVKTFKKIGGKKQKQVRGNPPDPQKAAALLLVV
jgi:hypothetical protein